MTFVVKIVTFIVKKNFLKKLGYNTCAKLLFLVIYQVWVYRYALNNISNSLRNDLFDKVYELDYCNYSKRETTYYISMMVNDVLKRSNNI